jgi:hypothetical protein
MLSQQIGDWRQLWARESRNWIRAWPVHSAEGLLLRGNNDQDQPFGPPMTGSRDTRKRSVESVLTAHLQRVGRL